MKFSLPDWRRPARRAAVLCALAAPPLGAQADTIAGRVIAPDGTPISQATVRATAAGGDVFAATSDAAGRYILAVPGPGDYAVQAGAFGYLSFTAAVQVPPGAGRVTRDFRLSARPVTLEAVRVVAATATGRERTTPAEVAERWHSFLTHIHPLDPGDFAGVGQLVPGVVASGQGLSMAGQSPDQNGTTLDGARFGGGSLPSEGVRSIGVFANTYDVSRGQFSGGQIAATTIGGTNLWGGAITARVDDPALRYGGSAAGLSPEHGRLARLSGGGGGALARDRLFVYGAMDLSHSSSLVSTLDRLDAEALRQMSLSPDSARRFAQIASRIGAVPPGAARPGEASNDAVRALARVDWVLPRHGSLMVRLDWRAFELAGLGASPLRLSAGTGRVRGGDGGVLVQHTASWGRTANMLRVYHASGSTRSDNGTATPTAEVRVASDLDDGSGGLSILSFGGTMALPAESRALWEIGDDLKLAIGGQQVHAGFLVQEERASHEPIATPGTFAFTSLADLEQGRAATFTRVLGGGAGEAVRRHGAAYLGSSSSPREGLWMIYGLRVEASRYGDRPVPVAALEALTDGTAGGIPSGWDLTPRIGFDYRTGGWTIRGGAGGFAGVPALEALARHWPRNGSGGQVLLSCVGPAAPAPAWDRYTDPAGVPTACADGQPRFASTAPATTLFHPGYRSPRTWRASLSAGRNVTSRVGMRFTGLLVHGRGLPIAADRNLRDTPAFVLPGEGARPVYAVPEQIDAATGGIAPGAGRVLSGFGAVEELGAWGRSWTGQLGSEVHGFYRRSILFSFRYTFTHSRMLAGAFIAPGAPAASTAGDPARLEWMEAPFTPRHHLYANVSGRPRPRVRVSAIATLRSGAPFTPMVGGDINGDGRANDRAFLFAPGQADDSALAEGLRRLLHAGPSGVRRCLRAGAGRVAAPGACRTAWSPSLDLRAEFTPWGARNARRFVLAVDARNVTAGLDRLVHGPGGLRGWGQRPAPDARLLEVRGFDRARGAFLYDVNPRFGRPVGGAARRSPFRLVLEGRITVGADPRYQPLMRDIDLGRGSRREWVRAELAERVRNVPAAVLQLDATDPTALALSPAQRAFLRAAADSLAPRFAAVLDSLATAFTAGGEAPVRAGRVQEASIAAARLHEVAAERVRAILTSQQWVRVPAWVTRPVDLLELRRPPRQQATVQ